MRNVESDPYWLYGFGLIAQKASSGTIHSRKKVRGRKKLSESHLSQHNIEE